MHGTVARPKTRFTLVPVSVRLSVCGKGKLEKHPRFNLSQLHLSFKICVGICGNYMMGGLSVRKDDLN